MAASIYDIAKRAGVSISTVSRVLNSSAGVSAKKAEAVRKAMDELSYSPNQFAQGMVTNRSRMIGIYIPHYLSDGISSTYMMEVITGISKALLKDSYSAVLIYGSENPGKEPDFLDFFRSRKIDGMIILFPPLKGEYRYFKEAVDAGYRLVNIGPFLSDDISNVYAQLEQYSFDMVKILYSRGHRKVLAPYFTSFAKGFEIMKGKIAEEMPDIEIFGMSFDFGPADLEKRANEILSMALREGCTAICGNLSRLIAKLIGVIRSHGLRIPEDMSLINVEHIRGAGEELFPAISSFYVPARDMGRCASEILMREISVKEPVVERRVLNAVYIERGSVISL